MNTMKFYTIIDWSNLSGFHYGQAVFVCELPNSVALLTCKNNNKFTLFLRFLVWSAYAARVAVAVVWAAIELDGPAVEGDTSSEGFGAIRAPSTSSANTTAM